ncbi:MAG: cytochrome c3 family protein [Gemmatimonadales bacterium]
MRTLSSKFLLALPLVGLLASCTSEKIVYRDRDPFNEPVAAAKGFLGYYSQETKRTTCGNCHVGHQQDWAGTAHANAYATLPAGSQDFCYSCHTVTDKGNVVTGLAGWDATKNLAYADVQCESCHGPGLEHVRNPEVEANWPVARGHVAVTEESCASCHDGTHHPYVAQWASSRHGQLNAYPAGRPECAHCHEGKAAIRYLSGQDPLYVERDEGAALPITCTVCHDPHNARFAGQLRASINTPATEQNLCMRCHIRVTEPSGGSPRGNSPHGPQGAVLVGTAGYRPAGFAPDESQIVSSHGSETANPRLCAGCHVNAFEITDPSGGFVFKAVGHTFGAIPCVDAQGVPTSNSNCAYTSTARSYAGCTTSGCHASAQVTASAIASLRQQVALLADQIWVDLNGNNAVDLPPVDGGYLPIIKRDFPGQLNPSDLVITPADGAEFNAKIFGEGRYGNGDGSLGVHNPFLYKALLAATIAELRSTYSLPAPPAGVAEIIDQSLKEVRMRQPGLFGAAAPR